MADFESPIFDENHLSMMQEILNAVIELPGVYERVEAFMIGRGIESPRAEITTLRDLVF